MKKINPFHLAIPVYNLDRCRKFYSETLDFEEGRSSERWVDYNFFGHQLVIHLKDHPNGKFEAAATNSVDGHDVPVPHFGVVLDWDHWHTFADLIRAKGIKFVIEPYIRFKGEVGEQATMFFLDPDGNALEFKAFKDMGQLFAK